MATDAAFITENSTEAGSWIPSRRTNGHCRQTDRQTDRQSHRQTGRRGKASVELSDIAIPLSVSQGVWLCQTTVDTPSHRTVALFYYEVCLAA